MVVVVCPSSVRAGNGPGDPTGLNTNAFGVYVAPSSGLVPTEQGSGIVDE